MLAIGFLLLVASTADNLPEGTITMLSADPSTVTISQLEQTLSTFESALNLNAKRSQAMATKINEQLLARVKVLDTRMSALSSPAQATAPKPFVASDTSTPDIALPGAEKLKLYIYPASALPPRYRGVLNWLSQNKALSEQYKTGNGNVVGPDQSEPYFYADLKNLPAHQLTTDPSKADLFYVPWFEQLVGRYINTLPDKGASLPVVRQDTWLKQQQHYPAKPHVITHMMCAGQPSAGNERNVNLYTLTIEGASECWGCMLKCSTRVLGPTGRLVQHKERFADLPMPESPYTGLAQFAGLMKGDIVVPYAANPMLLKRALESRTAGPTGIPTGGAEKEFAFVFRGNMNRMFVGGYVRRNLTQIVHRTTTAAILKSGSMLMKMVGGELVTVAQAPGTSPYRYDDELASSRYCLVPRGDSASCRHLFNSIAAGCIPIIISDAIVLPFDKQIDWSLFSVRVPECMVLDPSEHDTMRKLLTKLADDAVYGQLHSQLLRYRQFLVTGWGDPVSADYKSNPAFGQILFNEIALATGLIKPVAGRKWPATDLFDPWVLAPQLPAQSAPISSTISTSLVTYTSGKWEYQKDKAVKDFKCTIFVNNGNGNGCRCGDDAYVSEREKYLWAPTGCTLPVWDAATFCAAVAAKKTQILMLGDSTMEQSYAAVVSLVMASDLSTKAACLGAIKYVGSDTLVAKDLGAMNRGKHWTKGLLLHPQTTILILGVGAHVSNLTAFQEIVHSIPPDLDRLKSAGQVPPTLQLVWKTSNPPFGDEKGTCGGPRKIRTEYYDFTDEPWAARYNYMEMPKMDEYATGFFPSKGLDVINVKPLYLRGDAHAVDDCMHYCTPGPSRLSPPVFLSLSLSAIKTPTHPPLSFSPPIQVH
jgi:hypothetical protein